MEAKVGKKVDVQSVVEAPEIHILGRSTSSIEDQLKFNECRVQSLQDLAVQLTTEAGTPVQDILRFFHGDGPAQQFEAGHKQGGTYSCTGCGSMTSRFDDLTYCHHSPNLSFSERQEFVLHGEAWKKKGKNPLDNLKVGELRDELRSRGETTAGMNKPELVEKFNNVRKGINNVPALLQPNPDLALESLHLSKYEISPSEPLHDIKGHMSNVIEESLKMLTGEALSKVRHITETVLGADTLRCSDYRKGIILIYLALWELQPDSAITHMFRTLVELSEMLYSHESKRTAQAILRLHNVAFLHMKYCTDLFHTPKAMLRSRMFGRYFHSLTYHAPLVFRIISLRSLATEVQERMFNQCKSITKATSNKNANQVVTNILIRVQEEGKAHGTPQESFHRQQGEVQKLAQALPPKTNTVIPNSWILENPRQYQTHLERISDYLVKGPGSWWKQGENGIEFFDCTHDNQFPEHQMRHFRSSTLSDIDLYLHTKWEECNANNISLPASYVRHYDLNGSLSRISPETLTAPHLSTCRPETHPLTSETELDPQLMPGNPPQSLLSAMATAVHPPLSMSDDKRKPPQPQLSTSETATVSPLSTSTSTMTPMPSLPQLSTHTSNAIANTFGVSARPTFKTTLVQNLAKLITNDSKLLAYDTLRYKIKMNRDNNEKASRSVAMRCEKLSKYMKDQLQVVHKQQQQLLANLEKDFQKKNGRRPQTQDYTSSMQTAARLKSLASRLLLHE